MGVAGDIGDIVVVGVVVAADLADRSKDSDHIDYWACRSLPVGIPGPGRTQMSPAYRSVLGTRLEVLAWDEAWRRAFAF